MGVTTVKTNITSGVKELIEIISGEVTDYEGVPVATTTRKGLASVLDKSVRTVTRYIAQAEEEGLISTRSIKGNRGGLLIALTSKGCKHTPLANTDVFDRATITSENAENKLNKMNEAIRKSFERKNKTGKTRATKLESLAKKQRQLELSLENERKNELLKKRPITQGFTWEFFKETFKEDAVKVCGAYLLSRMYDAYFEASTNTYKAHNKDFPYSYNGTYHSLPMRGDWFGTSNYIQFESIFLEMLEAPHDIDFLKLWGNAFHIKNWKAVRGFKQTGDSSAMPRYAPYPKNLHLNTLIHTAQDSMLKLGSAIEKNRRKRNGGNMDVKWEKTLRLDELPMYDFYDPTCRVAGQAFKEFLGLARKNKGNAVRYFDIAYTEELPHLIREAYRYSEEGHLFRVDELTREASKAYFDHVLHAFYSLEDRTDKDFTELVNNPDNLVKLELFLKDMIAVKTLGISSSVFTSSSPYMYHPLIKLRRTISYLDNVLHQNGKLNAEDEKLMNSVRVAISNLVPNSFDKEQYETAEEWKSYLATQERNILEMVHPASSPNFEQLTEAGFTLRQLSGVPTVLPDDLAPILNEISEDLFLDEFGLVDWERVFSTLILDSEEYVGGYDTPREEYEIYFG